jgi:hypothetical protein
VSGCPFNHTTTRVFACAKLEVVAHRSLGKEFYRLARKV